MNDENIREAAMRPRHDSRAREGIQKVHVFNCRSEYVSIFRKSLLTNKALLLGVLASLTVHIAAIYLPWTQTLLSLTALDAMTWLVAAAVAATAIFVNELHKKFRTGSR